MLPARTPDYPIAQVFLDRWSPRAFDGSEMPVRDLMTVLEAARWAPSAYNIQPWRFLYARRGDENWAAFLATLDPFNAAWAENASALVFALSDTRLPEADGAVEAISPTHRFDAGAAWAQLALQATASGYQAHAMAGVDFVKVRKTLRVPERYFIEIAIAVGTQSDPASLPAGLRDREKPSGRLPLDEIVFAGPFPHVADSAAVRDDRAERRSA